VWRGLVFAAGAVAVAIWALGLSWGGVEFLTLFGALDRLELAGPFGLPMTWWAHLPQIAAGFGAVALAGAAAGRRAGFAVAGVLALGAAFLVAWLVDPPAPTQGISAASYAWPAFAATAALAVGAVAAAAMTRPTRGPRARETARGR
jgi:hypothetical protein